MLETSFSPVNLGLIAYARVLSGGTAPDLNSGVVVERLSTGVFQITLPVGMGEPEQSCLTLLQGIGGVPINCAVEHVSDRVKIIATNNRVGGKSNGEFYVAFFRTTGKYDWVKSPDVMYVRVGSDGSVPNSDMNSGVTVQRLALGSYRLTLSTNQNQEMNDSLVFVQPFDTTVNPLLCNIQTTSTATVKNINVFNRIGGSEDTSFVAIIMRVAE